MYKFGYIHKNIHLIIILNYLIKYFALNFSYFNYEHSHLPFIEGAIFSKIGNLGIINFSFDIIFFNIIIIIFALIPL